MSFFTAKVAVGVSARLLASKVVALGILHSTGAFIVLVVVRVPGCCLPFRVGRSLSCCRGRLLASRRRCGGHARARPPPFHRGSRAAEAAEKAARGWRSCGVTQLCRR